MTVVEGAVTDGAAGRADGEPPVVEQVSATIPVLGSLVHDLIECREDVVGELDFWEGKKRFGIYRGILL